MKKKITHTIGVDEAGRGPLAGPVSVGVVCVPQGFDWKTLPFVDDSKRLSEKKREDIFMRTRILKRDQKLAYAVSLVSASVIDRIGITRAVSLGITRALSRINMDADRVEVKLDGLLKAPREYEVQETIIKGDQKEKVIGLASIMAKVTRDRHMVRMGARYGDYGFEIHKGYGTKTHRRCMRDSGLSKIHRRSFGCRS